MGKKEFKIGEEFQCGLTRLKCIEKNNDSAVYEFDYSECGSCVFRELWYVDCNIITGKCSRSNRSDKTDVIFIEVKDETI